MGDSTWHIESTQAYHNFLVGLIGTTSIGTSTVHVANVDILARIPPRSDWKLVVHPFRVTREALTLPPTVAPGNVRIRSICSLISSGTELKFFRGAPMEADATLAALNDSTSNYGYSLVGTSTSSTQELLFAFHPHASVADVAEKGDARAGRHCA